MKQFFRKHHQFICITFLIVIFISIYSIETYARVGGAGGRHSGGSGGGDGSGIIALLFYLLFSIPFPWNIIIIGFLIWLGWWGNKQNKQQSVLNQLPNESASDRYSMLTRYQQENPAFKPDFFKAKVKHAFMQIQESWMLKDMAKVRKYISDGMYQRLNTQFKMMSILDQQNNIENLTVNNIHIDKIERDGHFDIIHVAIHASIVDRFISKKYPQFNSGGSEDFVEYWSFIKKRGIIEGNLFDTQNCPNCGAELPKNAGDVSQCSYCKTFTNLGDYDWVLSEITQADDYVATYSKASKESSLANKVNQLLKTNEDFSIQNIEDKASNGYLQIITAKVLKESTVMRRFVSNELYEKLSHYNEGNVVYNRIYLNDVTLIGASTHENKNLLSIAIKSSYQRVLLSNGEATLIDPFVASKTDVVIMSRDTNPQVSKGSLYAHVCPSCGGPVKDTIDIQCQYCGSALNSTKNEWIITDILDASSYSSYYHENKDEFVAGIDIAKLDSIYDVRDYAFNNILVVMAADRHLDQQELDMAEKLAKKWGYNTNRIQPLFEMARNNVLFIRMPDDMKKRQKIFTLMEKAAAIDGLVTPEEQKVLNGVKQNYLSV